MSQRSLGKQSHAENAQNKSNEKEDQRQEERHQDHLAPGQKNFLLVGLRWVAAMRAFIGPLTQLSAAHVAVPKCSFGHNTSFDYSLAPTYDGSSDPVNHSIFHPSWFRRYLFRRLRMDGAEVLSPPTAPSICLRRRFFASRAFQIPRREWGSSR